MPSSQTNGELLLPKHFHTAHIETLPFYPLPARKRMMRYKPAIAFEFINKFKSAEEITLSKYIGLSEKEESEINQAEELVINDLLRKNAIHFIYRNQYHPECRRKILIEILKTTMVKNIRSKGYILHYEFEKLIPETTKELFSVINTFIETLLMQTGKEVYKYLSDQLHINGMSGMISSFDYFLLRYKDLWSRCELQGNKLFVEKIEQEMAIITCISTIKRNSKSPKEEINTKITLQKKKNWWIIYSLESESFPEIKYH